MRISHRNAQQPFTYEYEIRGDQVWTANIATGGWERTTMDARSFLAWVWDSAQQPADHLIGRVFTAA